MKTFELNGIEWECHQPEDRPELFAMLLKECERLNNADGNLIKINSNTWIKKD